MTKPMIHYVRLRDGGVICKVEKLLFIASENIYLAFVTDKTYDCRIWMVDVHKFADAIAQGYWYGL